MSPAAEIGLVAGRELRKSFRSVKGIILAVLALLGSVAFLLFAIWGEAAQRDKLNATSSDAFATARETYLTSHGVDAAAAHYEAHVPISFAFFFKVLVVFGPLLVVVLGFDTVSSDVQHRSVRFWTVRSRRSSYLLGKYLGLWGTVSSVTLALTLLSGLALLVIGYISFGDFLTWGLRFWLFATLIVGTWASVGTLISSLFKTPLFALLATLASFFLIWVPGAIGAVVRWGGAALEVADKGDDAKISLELRWYEWLDPNNYDDLLTSPKLHQVATGVGLCALWVVVFVGLASLLFSRRDV